MTTAFDLKFVPFATKIIKKFGTTMEFNSTVTVEDPSTLTVTETETAHNWLASPPVPVDTALMNGETVQMGDMMIWIAAENLTFTPVLGMRVVHNSESYRITSLDEFHSGDSIAAYRLILRS